MATFDGNDMKLWREAQGISAADLAERINCDTVTLYRYQSGKIKPNPDVMYQICRELGDTRRWQEWMRTEYPMSYGREHPEPVMHGLEGSIMALFSEIRDLEELERQTLKDGADGIIDCEKLHDDLIKEITELIQAAQSAKSILEAVIAHGKATER